MKKKNRETRKMKEDKIESAEMTDKKKLMNNDSNTCKLNEDNKNEDQAPEGGWGWFVTTAMVVIIITVIGPSPSIGLVFGNFLESTGQVGLFLTLFGAVFSVTFCIFCSLAHFLTKKYTLRLVALMGAIFFSASSILLALATTISQMMILYLTQGVGVGLLLTISNTNFNAYFVKKRTQIMSMAQVIVGIGCIGYPYFINQMMPIYGFRGTAGIIGAISLNCIPAVLLLQPVEWHTKDPKQIRAERILEAEEKSRKLQKFSRSLATDVHQESLFDKSISLRSLKQDKTKKTALLLSKKEELGFHPDPTEIRDYRMRSSSFSTKDALSERLFVFSSSSLTNVASGLGAFVADMESNSSLLINNTTDKTNTEKKESLLNTLNQIFDFTVMKDICFVNLSLGASVAITCDYTFASLLPIMMVHNGYTTSDFSLVLMIGSLTELIVRIFLAIFNYFVKFKSKYLFFIAMIAMSFAKAGFVAYENTLMAVIVMNAIIGMIRPMLLVPQSLVVVEDVPKEKVAPVYGCFGFIMGCTSLFLGPILGQLRDWTDSYKIFQYVTLGVHTFFIFPWALQFILVDFKEWRKIRPNDYLPTPSN
ncbi:hypothetical protein M0802_001074 [Mischocyttarus mexicanus]|nr:hypothetical protein M0802_001074 [Mischocyttarus mexicanus]